MLFVYVGVCHRSPHHTHAASKSTMTAKSSTLRSVFPASEEFGPRCQIVSSSHMDLITSKVECMFTNDSFQPKFVTKNHFSCIMMP